MQGHPPQKSVKEGSWKSKTEKVRCRISAKSIPRPSTKCTKKERKSPASRPAKHVWQENGTACIPAFCLHQRSGSAISSVIPAIKTRRRTSARSRIDSRAMLLPRLPANWQAVPPMRGSIPHRRTAFVPSPPVGHLKSPASFVQKECSAHEPRPNVRIHGVPPPKLSWHILRCDRSRSLPSKAPPPAA